MFKKSGIILISILFFIRSFSYSNDWNLFQPKIKFFYGNGQSSLECSRLDTFQVTGGKELFLFNRDYNDNGLISSCELINNISIDSLANSIVEVPYLFQNIYRKQDTVFCQNIGIPYFLPKALPGTSWTFPSDGITITCDSIMNEIFLGLTDSVKIFTITSTGNSPASWNGLQYKLSKNYGLIEFPILSSFPGTYTLKGIELSSGYKHGFLIPAFHQFFHLQPGDLLMWRTFLDPADFQQPSVTEFMLDSITQSLIYPDSVIYIFNRKVLNRYGNIISYAAQKKKYDRTEFEKHFNNPDNSSVFSAAFAFNMVPDSKCEWRSSVSLEGVTHDQLRLNLMFDGHYIDTVNCVYQQVVDIALQYKLDTIAGVILYGEYSFGSYTEVLTGYRINGITKGSVSLGVNEKNQEQVLMYPNPLEHGSELKFSVSVSDIVVYDISGREIMRGSDTRPTLLPAGTYVVQFNCSGELFKKPLVVY